jgi:hypothetical protein
VDLAGAKVVLRPAGALWLEAEGALVVADLHLEKGSSYAARGQLLPPFDTRETLARLEAEVDALGPRLLVFLGDTFHDGEGEARLTDAETGRVAALARGRSLVWVLGNHDPAPPRRLPGDSVSHLAVAGLLLVHEPAEGSVRGEVAGHLHPCAKVASVGRRRLILPAFGAYAGGLNVRDPAIAGRLARPAVAAVLGDGRVHAIAWRSLRSD